MLTSLALISDKPALRQSFSVDVTAHRDVQARTLEQCQKQRLLEATLAQQATDLDFTVPLRCTQNLNKKAVLPQGNRAMQL